MNKKNIIRFSFLSVFFFFLCLYLYQASNYYEYVNYKRTKINYEKINEFEDDLKNGKNVEEKDYIDEEKTYSNTIYKLGITTSNLIEKSFNKLMKYLFSEASDAVNGK